LYDGAYTALTKDEAWKADTTTAIFPTDTDGEVTSYDDPSGLEVKYISDRLCSDEADVYMTFTMNVMCVEEAEGVEPAQFK
jgi:hypothetical protein